MSKLRVKEIAHSNGTQAMTVDSSGRIATPARPAFVAYRTSAQSLTAGNDRQILQFDQTTRNVGNHFGTSTYYFTVPITGLLSAALFSYGYFAPSPFSSNTTFLN